MVLEEYEGFVVIGAGPAGSAFTYLASRKLNADVIVYEALSRPGAKACGWGLIRSVEEYIDVIPKRYILNKIKGFKIYVDNVEVVRYVSRKTFAYMIDRPKLMEYYIGPGNVHFNTKVSIEEITKNYPNYLPVIASGYMWSPRKRKLIIGVEYLVENAKIDEPEHFEVHTWQGFIGYLWIFPFNDRIAHVGVGGLTSYSELVNMLETFLKNDYRFKNISIAGKYVGLVSIDGVRKEYMSPNYPVIGEALGTVLPLTGEGMRPSIISAWCLVEAIKRGNWRLYLRLLKRTGVIQSIVFQKKVFEYIERRHARLNVSRIKSLVKDCEWLVYEIAFGRPSWSIILKALPCGLHRAIAVAGLLKRYMG